MEQETRNKLQRATQQIRRLLEEEFAEQLEGTFDILASGKILPSEGKHLDARQRLTRQKLVDAVEHIKAGGKKPQEAVEEYTREAAFTFLNRFVALRMLEARGLLQECVSKGDQSSGFREFTGLAPGLASLPDGGYRLYLECLFDELSVEVKVLFDRRDSASLLWPRRGALTDLLDILGEVDLAGVWREDETIGWVYQYFNSGEERRKMRDESQAPRNSRELAVRNQFFTPRYVVEFLTDNTLGRIWYEMQKGKTRLIDECRYLVRRPSEVFMIEGQEPPKDESDAELNLSQDEFLKKTVYLLHRVKKDPRDLKILDPACGSGHFLLYAFDLLISIYEEAWHDAGCPKSQVTGRTLKNDYPELQQLHAALPGLVLAHNLHGIDIDPRAAQIAALALWMRGQRAFNEFQISREQRPAIARSNIVCAEPMPGEAAFLDEFIAEHLSEDAEGRFLASLVRKVFEAMKLAGEAGSLLKIEEDITEEVAKAKKQWLERPKFKQKTLFVDSPNTVQKELDLTRGITDETFWEEAEQGIYDALRAYSEQSERRGAFQRRLFASDAAKGFALIDLCRTLFDVVLMNPPFGEASIPSRPYLYRSLASSSQDLFAAFVERFAIRLCASGRLGVISNRLALFKDLLKDWRAQVLLGGVATLRELADLGYGVLDDAVVEAAGYVIEASGTGFARDTTCFTVLDAEAKQPALLQAIQDGSRAILSSRLFAHRISSFQELPGNIIAYWCSDTWLRRVATWNNLSDQGVVAKKGLETGDDFRFLRLMWETPQEDLLNFERWTPYSKGGDYRPYHADLHLAFDWHNVRAARRRSNSDLYGRAGLTYTERTTSNFAARVLPKDTLFSPAGPGVFPRHDTELWGVLGFLNSAVAAFYLELFVGGGDTSAPGTAARHFSPVLIERIPVPPGFDSLLGLIGPKVESMYHRLCRFRSDEKCADFTVERLYGDGIAYSACVAYEEYEEALVESLTLLSEIEDAINDSYGLGVSEVHELKSLFGRQWVSQVNIAPDVQDRVLAAFESSNSAESMTGTEDTSFNRAATKLCFLADRRYESLASSLGINFRSIADIRRQHGVFPPDTVSSFGRRLISVLVGSAFGRDFSMTMGQLENPFDTLSRSQKPSSPKNKIAIAILVDDEGHPQDVSQLQETILRRMIPQECDAILGELYEILGSNSLRTHLRSTFFNDHIRDYSRSRRKAPIYWQLGTPSASYSLWLYYHGFTRDTFFQILNEYVKPKLDHERQKLERVRGEGGAEPTRSQRKEIEDQEKFVAEMASMSEEVERIAPLWNPNLNDGVIINFAPLWRLVPQNKAWQKECKTCWDQLVAGEYDWAHLAMHLWPERVVLKCINDASLAIAHGLEQIFWEQDDRERFQPKAKPEGGWQPVIDQLMKERTSPAVKAALRSLLEAPVAAAPSRKSRARRGAAS